MSTHNQLLDNPQRYGTVSRLLHWSMALLLALQLATALSHLLLQDSAIDSFLWPTHKPLGLILMLLIIFRAAWSLRNRGHRPPSLGPMAQLGHLGLYALMIAIPLLGLLRQYGSGRAFSPFGLPLMPGFEGDGIAWMTLPGNALHSWLAGLGLARNGCWPRCDGVCAPTPTPRSRCSSPDDWRSRRRLKHA